MMQTASLNKFDRKFQELERRLGKDPSRIEWLVRSSPAVRRLVGTLYFWDIDFKARLLDKTHLEVESWFMPRYRLYHEKYSPEVQRVHGILHLLALEQEQVDGIPAEEILKPDGIRLASEDQYQYFSPGIAEGAEAVEFVLSWFRNMSDGSIHEEELNRGVEAWDYFSETVGVDLAGIETRWNNLPRAMVPKAASPSTAEHSNSTSLLHLLENAAKAYVFGLYPAAIVMCRVVCERTLRQLYDLAVDENTKLNDLIFFAEKRYQSVKGLDLRTHKKAADSILHKNGWTTGLSKQEDEAVRQFLQTVKTLIEQSPSRPVR